MSQLNQKAFKGSQWRVLREKLAARIDSAAEMVEAEQDLSVYCTDDAQSRQDLVSELERAFSIQIDTSAFDTFKTVGDLAEFIAARKLDGKVGKRAYIVIYKGAEGRVIEEHVRADNHEAAVEALRASGLQEVLSVSREEDEDRDSDFFIASRRWTRFVAPLVLALLTAAGVIAFFWWRRH